MIFSPYCMILRCTWRSVIFANIWHVYLVIFASSWHPKSNAHNDIRHISMMGMMTMIFSWGTLLSTSRQHCRLPILEYQIQITVRRASLSIYILWHRFTLASCALHTNFEMVNISFLTFHHFCWRKTAAKIMLNSHAE